MIIGDFLRLSARRLPSKTAVVANNERLSYEQLDKAANQFAHALAGLGLPAASTVAIQSSNCWEYAAAFFGIARAGHVSAHISAKVTSHELRFMIEKTRAQVLLVGAGLERRAREALEPARTGVRMVVLGSSHEDIPGESPFSAFIENQPAELPEVEVRETDPLAITFTGGTTGLPKGVLVSHRARVVTAETALVLFGLDETDIVCVATPLFHAAGLFVVFAPPVLLGCTTVLLPMWDVGLFMGTVEKERVSATLLVPSQLNDLVSHPEFDAARLKSLRKIGYAGAPMSRALFERIRTALPHVEFTENYGQTETGPIAVRCPWHPPAKLSAVGRPSFNAEVDVVDETCTPVPRGTIGEIVTRGPHVFTEYYEDPKQTAACFRGKDGWLWTGDLGYIDEDGFVYLVDRSKDMLISGGENVYPAEIENALYQHAAVAECAVFGIPDEHWGEVPAAHVVLKSNSQVTEEELIAFCTTLVARHKRPRVVRFVSSLPRTAVGKIQKNVLRDPYWAGHERKI